MARGHGIPRSSGRCDRRHGHHRPDAGNRHDRHDRHDRQTGTTGTTGTTGQTGQTGQTGERGTSELYRVVGCRSRGSSAYTHGPSVREVAVGFDDGPWTDTAAFVTMLERSHARATFFMIGRQVNEELSSHAAARAA